MKNYTIAFLVSAAFFTACGTPAPTNTNVSNAANQSAPNRPAANANSTNASIISPIETMKALNTAAKNKDTAAVKTLISKGTLALLETDAKDKGTTVDEMLTSDDDALFEELPKMRNESIVGDKATVEVNDGSTDEWQTVPLVKEEGVWKIALDEYLEEVKQRMVEEMSHPPSSSNKEKSADRKNTNANKAAKN